MPGEVVARRTEIARERWEAMTTWPLIAASVLFLVAYSWGILDSELTPGGLLAIGLVLGLVWLAFLVDYVVRILLSVDKLYFVAHSKIDLLSVLVPIARPFRLLKGLARMPFLRANSGAALRRRVLIIAGAFVVMFIYVISLAEYAVERDAEGALITSFGDSVWWACVTMATVGYGDYYPVTVTGRILAVILMVGGIAIAGAATATFVSYVNERMSTAREHEHEHEHRDSHHEPVTGRPTERAQSS